MYDRYRHKNFDKESDSSEDSEFSQEEIIFNQNINK